MLVGVCVRAPRMKSPKSSKHAIIGSGEKPCTVPVRATPPWPCQNWMQQRLRRGAASILLPTSHALAYLAGSDAAVSVCTARRSNLRLTAVGGAHQAPSLCRVAVLQKKVQDVIHAAFFELDAAAANMHAGHAATLLLLLVLLLLPDQVVRRLLQRELLLPIAGHGLRIAGQLRRRTTYGRGRKGDAGVLPHRRRHLRLVLE